jgi:hypothetical protein
MTTRLLALLALTAPLAVTAQQPGARHIAVIEADSTILVNGNPFPFTGRSLVFRPARAAYAVETGPLQADAERGARAEAAYGLDPAEIALPFSFPFFGRQYRRAYAYLYGAVAFERAPNPDTRVYPGVLDRHPPLVAALFHPADRHPTGGGFPDGVYVNAASPDRVVITWYQVMAAQVEQVLNTYQVTLYRDGTIRVSYQDIQYPEGMVGLSAGPSGGRAVDVRLVDLAGRPRAGSFYEWFRSPEYDPAAVGRAFYRAHPDSFDVLAVFESFPVSHAAVAMQLPVKNDVRGIGLDLFDRTRDYGSLGRLHGLLELNTVAWVGPNEASGMLGHEFAHRWLAYVSFLDERGQRSSDLLEAPRGSHWCFYLDTRTGMTWDGFPTHSFMFGSKWDDLPDGRLQTGGSTSWGYSPLDLYLMGLIPADSVPDFFYVADRPDQGQPCVTGSNPTPGRKRTVSVRQIIAAEGPRNPDVTRSQKQFRTAFVLLVRPGSVPAREQLATLDRLRLNWGRDFPRYTGGRATMDTRLRWDSTPAPGETTDSAAPEAGAVPLSGWRLRAEPRDFGLYWSGSGGTRRFAIARAWLVPKVEQARERDAYVSSFNYDTAVTAFAVGDGTIGLHVSSYAIQPEGSAGAAAGRDVFLVFDPRSGLVRPGLAELGITKERVRGLGCPGARTSHFLTADVDGDGRTDIGKIDERIYCLETFEGARPTIVGPRYEQSLVTWFVFRAGRWRVDATYRGRMPDRLTELPLIGLVLTPVDFVAYATWRTYDTSKWGESTTPTTRFVPAYRRRLAAEQGRRP